MRLASDGNPLAGMPFYVNPSSKARAAADGVDPRSPELDAIANTPTAYWMDNLSTPAVDAKYIAAAQAAGTMPVLALYGIPHRDCGSFAAGGFGSADAYKGWIDGVASAIGGGPAAIILEPDALAMADCLSGDQRQERFDLMRYAVDTLTRNPATAVYIDGGHSRWVSAEDMAARLNDVGVGKARGFSLNTANFFTTEEEIGYGDAISGLTNGAHYVIDTSRNGAGPADGDDVLVQPERPGARCRADDGYRQRQRRRLPVGQTSRRIRRVMRPRRARRGALRELVRHRTGPQRGPVDRSGQREAQHSGDAVLGREPFVHADECRAGHDGDGRQRLDRPAESDLPRCPVLTARSHSARR